jgi:hypothetical protein
MTKSLYSAKSPPSTNFSYSRTNVKTHHCGQLDEGHQTAMVEDKELQVGGLKDVRLEVVKVRQVVVLLHGGVESRGTQAHGEVTQVIHQVRHQLQNISMNK